MEINYLIVKYLAGCISEEEVQVFEKWLQEDESHRQLFQEICSDGNLLENYRRYSYYNTKSGETFRKVWTSLNTGVDEVNSGVLLKKSKTKRMHNWLKVACSLLIMLFLAGEIFYYYHASILITPGESKASLTLEDGSVRHLKASGMEHWIYVGSTPVAKECNGIIVYDIPESVGTKTSLQNILSVPRGGEFRLTLSDGTKIHLNSLSSLKYPVNFHGMDKRVVELEGEAYFEVAKDSLRPFEILSQGLLIRQIGTEFSVRSRMSGKVEVALVQGSVALNLCSGESVTIQPGQLGVWDASTDDIYVENKELLSYTAWHSSRFVFYDEGLGHLMEELALWYNVEIGFLDESLKELHFTGSLYRYDDISVILNAIEETVNVNFEISGRRIEVEKKINNKSHK